MYFIFNKGLMLFLKDLTINLILRIGKFEKMFKKFFIRSNIDGENIFFLLFFSIENILFLYLLIPEFYIFYNDTKFQ